MRNIFSSMVLWYILKGHTSVGSETGWSQKVHPALGSVSWQQLWVRACRGVTTGQVTHPSPWGTLNQSRVLVTFSGNLFTSLCSPWATINWLLSKTSFLMELQTSTFFVYAESGICEGNLMPTQLFCGKRELTFNLSCHSRLCKLLSYCPMIFQTEKSYLVAFFLKQ